MKLAELIDQLQKLEKENDLGADSDVMVYDAYSGSWHVIDIECNGSALEIVIDTE